ncbi:MAG TPA: aminoacyl-histidine dipeptidase, partial [Gillisia sp.]|nr:aminoacyl-histidine dipeptidase [Gillisia sp.]
MNNEIRNLNPTELWNKFSDLNAVPRPSKKEERVIAFIKDFGEKLGLETRVDKVGNVIIKKLASQGMENRKAVILQSHLDMVHQKNSDTQFDFDKNGIEMYVDGDWVRAKGTTLGADNGLGVASIMAVLESNTIAHPELEALFTIDEETGMTGAKGLEPGMLNGEILLNLDTEEDDEIGIGCAGGVDITATGDYQVEDTPEGSAAFKIRVEGLQGGHSGMDIIKGLGNANKLMNRILFRASEELDLRISSINGGGLRNAIPRESEAIVIIDEMQVNALKDVFEDEKEIIKNEFTRLEPKLNISLTKTEVPESIMESGDQDILLRAIYGTHNGVFRMSPDIEGLVETSNNIARVEVKEGAINVNCLTRSSVDSSKHDLSNGITAVLELAGYEVKLSGEYPGWTPNPESDILKVMDELYQKMNNKKANVAACHAGLECGIIGKNYPEVDMISFGPTIRGAHSPDER